MKHMDGFAVSANFSIETLRIAIVVVLTASRNACTRRRLLELTVQH